MPMTIRIPDDAPEHTKEKARDLDRRAKVIRQYDDLREKHGWERAMERLGERHGFSKHTVREILLGRR